MIMRFIYSFFICILGANLAATLGLSCSRIETNNENEASSARFLDTCQVIKNGKSVPYNAAFEAYQYFDEYLMRGIGKADRTDSVFVWLSADTIIVSMPTKTDSIIKYSNKAIAWCNYQYYDFNRDSYLKDGRYRRSYVRYVVRDSIIECRRMFDIDNRVLNASIFLKTKKMGIYQSREQSQCRFQQY